MSTVVVVRLDPFCLAFYDRYIGVIETCFGESFHLSCMSLVLKDLFPLKIIVVIIL